MAEINQLTFGYGVIGFEGDNRFNRLTPFLVGNADDRRLQDRRIST